MRGFILSLVVGLMCSMAVAKERCAEVLIVKGATAHPWSGKILVFDTNILLHDPQAMFKYPGAAIVVSGTVMEELDAKKTDTRLGPSARVFSRELLRMINEHGSAVNIPLTDDATLTMDYHNYVSEIASTTLDPKKKDNEILATAIAYGNQHGDNNVLVVSDDLNVRIKAMGLGLKAEALDAKLAPPPVEDGVRVVEVSDETLKTFLSQHKMEKPPDLNIAPNEFVMLKSPTIEASGQTVARFHFDREHPETLTLKGLPDFKKLPFQPLNVEQAMALDVLLDPSVDCVILEAKAGTGKTFLTLMAALRLMKEQKYSKVFVTKPTVHVGHNNPGALPGSINAKYAEWMKPYFDNLATLSGKDKVIKDLPEGFELLPFEFMRGRTIPNSMIVVDEFQNTNVSEAKTILTRVGDNTKIVIMGDASQIDVSPNFLNARNNGLTIAAEKLTDPSLSPAQRSRVARVKLVEGVRSGFADLASDVFEK